MKTLIYILSVIIIFGALGIGDIKAHLDNQKQATAATVSLQTVEKQLNDATKQASDLKGQLTSQSSEATAQFNEDQKQLCTFIAQHVNAKAVALPAECTAIGL